MLRLSKMADYGIVLMSYIAQTDTDAARTARDLAEVSNLPLPTVSKVLKALSRAGLLSAQRGKRGGYALVRTAGEINVAEMIAALDGPIALTDCSHLTPGACDLQPSCPTRGNWSLISATVDRALADLSLADLSPTADCCKSTANPSPLEILP